MLGIVTYFVVRNFFGYEIGNIDSYSIILNNL